MNRKDFLHIYLNKLTQKIQKFQQQWKGTRYAALDQSTIDPQDQDQNQYEQFLEKYRGKNGTIKPLGLILYQKYLRSLFVLFFALTLLFVPVTMVYSFGEGLSQFETSSFSKSTLLFSVANIPKYRLDDLSESDLYEINFQRYLTLTTDIIAICVVFVFLMYIKIQINKITNHYMAKCPPPHLYCLEVSNIQGQSQQKIMNHFSRLGKVSQVSGIYHQQNNIYYLSKIVKLVCYLCALKPQNKKYDQIYLSTKQKIRKKYFQLAETYLSKPKPQLKQAFVCFEWINDRNRVYDLYKYEINPKNLIIEEKQIKNSMMLSENTQRSNKMMKIRKQSEDNDHQQTKIHFQEHLQSPSNQIEMRKSTDSIQVKNIRPVVKKCKFQPLTINWENCDIDKKSQKIKFMCQFILLLIVAFVILLGLFLLNINSTHVKQSQIQNLRKMQKAQTRSFQKDFSNKSDYRQKYTFCASIRLSEFKWQYYNQCAEYFQFERNKFMLMLTFSSMVALINMLTNRILQALVTFRRYKTLAQRNHFLVTSVFIFSVFNSAILTILIRFQYTGRILRSIIGKILNFPQDVMQVTLFSQFNRQWYLMIGSQLMMNYMVSLIIFPNLQIIIHWIRTLYRQFMQKHAQKQGKKPVFNYCMFYAMSLKAIFFSLIYSNSMPAFYLLCAIALAIQMMLGKFLMKHFVEQPVFVDNNTIQVAVNILPYALLLHCLSSIFFLNVQQIFPTLSSYENIHHDWKQASLLKLQRGFIYIVFIIFIGVYIWNRERMDRILLKYWFGRTQSKFQCDLTRKFKEIKINPAFLASYKMRDNPKYKILYYALHLFCSHMQKIRSKGGIESLKSYQSLDISNIFTQQQQSQSTTVRNDLQKMASYEQVQIIDFRHEQALQKKQSQKHMEQQNNSQVESQQLAQQQQIKEYNIKQMKVINL